MSLSSYQLHNKSLSAKVIHPLPAGCGLFIYRDYHSSLHLVEVYQEDGNSSPKELWANFGTYSKPVSECDGKWLPVGLGGHDWLGDFIAMDVMMDGAPRKYER